MLGDFSDARLWYNDGTNADGKVVANPTIGYGVYTITHGDGSSREFYRIGVKFRRLSVINADALKSAIRHGMTVDHG